MARGGRVSGKRNGQRQPVVWIEGHRWMTWIGSFVLLALLVGPGAVRAQVPVSIVSPTQGQRLAATPDYATEVLGDPWDFSNREDYSLWEFENAGLSDLGLDGQGLLTGTFATDDATVGLLYRGLYGGVNPGRSGRRFPIDPMVYSKLAFKLAAAPGEVSQVFWYHYPHDHPTGANRFGGLFVPGQTAAGFRILVVDLTSANLGVPGEDWTAGPVLGLRLDPNGTSNSIGQQMRLDWVRLVPGDSSPLSLALAIEWTGPPGSYDLSVQELGTDPAEPLVIASGISGTTFGWRYDILPPGPYRLTVTHPGSGGSATVDFVINSPPIAQVTDPDETGGDDDFATLVLGDSWDMSDPGDVVRVDNLASSDFSGGQFNGTSVTGEIGRDSQVWLLKNDTNPAPLIDPSRFHRLTYRYTLDGPFDPGPGGSVARVFWGAILNHPEMLSTSEDIVVWSGPNSYTIDLSTLRVGTDLGIEPTGPGELWGDGMKRFFRFDPHEGAAGRAFHIDDVRLAADDRVSPGGQFTIRWTWSDGDAGDAPTVTLYDDTDQDSTNGKTLIASGLPAADGQYVWTAPSTVGTHYIYAEISDGLNTTARYATGPLQVSSEVVDVCGDCIDNDGNGLVDYEDASCCPQPDELRITSGHFLASKGGLARGHLALAASVGSSFTTADPSAEDVTIQLRNASGELLCAALGRQLWKKAGHKGFKFRAAGLIAAGPKRGTLRPKRGGAQFTTSSPQIDLSRYEGDLRVTLRVGGHCARGAAILRARGKKGFVYP